jgi:REP element-mobilizing transposase RayT
MVEYRRSAHATYDLKYHVIWITKYRYKILRGRLAERARDLIRQICQAREVAIIRGSVSPDHIHMLLSAPPHLAPAKLAVHKGAVITSVTRRVPRPAETLLGTASVGTRLLLRDGGRGGRGDD